MARVAAENAAMSLNQIDAKLEAERHRRVS